MWLNLISLAFQRPRLAQLYTPRFTFLTMSRGGDIEAQRDLSQSHRASSRLVRYYEYCPWAGKC